MPRILVTGAASGIGAATVARLRATGCDVVELDVVAGPGRVRCDLGDEGSVAEAAAAVSGRLDGIAHVAGLPGTHPAGRVLAVNYLGPRALTGRLAPQLAHDASIVFVSSLAAHRCAWPDADLAALARESWSDALATLSRHACTGSEAYDLSKRLPAFELPRLAARFAASGVRVNVVSPGPVETPILADFRATMGADRIDAARTLAGRHARPDEIAAAIAFLLDPAASWINGVDLRADGGLSAYRAADV